MQAIGGLALLLFLAICVACAALLFGCALPAGAALKPPVGIERLGSDMLPCPDGTQIEREVWDPDPTNRNAFILVFKRGEEIVAIFDSLSMTLTLASGEEIDIVTAAQRWPSPCQFPLGV